MKEEKEGQEYLEYYNVVVDGKQTPIRLDKFLMDRLEKVSRSRVQKAISNGAILVNDKAIKSSYKVRPNDFIRVFLPKSDQDREMISPEDIPLDIKYEDDQVIVLHKPAGLVVHPGIGNWSGTLVNGLSHYLKGQNLPVLDGNPGDRPGLVHRIDKDTSGLMVIAKTQDAITHLGKQFFNHTTKRKYTALVWGEPDPYNGTIEGYVGRHEKDRKRMFLHQEEDKGKHAITHYKVIEPLYYVSLVECQLETGRTHQIRVSFQSTNNPLFNDTKYGGHRILKGTVFTKYKQFVDNCFKIMTRQALHASTLGFVHPATNEEMLFESPLPEDMSNLLDKWRKYVHTKKEMLKTD